MRIPFQLSVMASAVILAGCGGGGGPGGANTRPSSGEYYTTPVVVGRVDPSAGISTSFYEYESFNKDVTGDGSTDVVLAGRMTAQGDPSTHINSNLQMLSWENGTLVDRTAQWFPGGINEIKGTEPSVHFADFWNTGRNDLFVAHGTDMEYYGPSYVFRNTGSRFERIEIPMNNVWSHGSDIGDINNDGYTDIAIMDYGPNTTLAINNTVDNFVTYVDARGNSGDLRWGGSDVAIGDYNKDGNTEFIVIDNGCQTGLGCDNSATTRMYSYTIDPVTDELNFNYMQDLPLPYLKANGYDVENHSVRVINHDFNEDGNDDVIVISRDFNWFNELSAVQFLQNDGTGVFTDVTDDVLIGYNMNTAASYNPVFLDINNDGKTDILLSGGDYNGDNDSHQFLLKSADNKYVAAYQDILTEFATGEAVSDGFINNGNRVTVFKAPDGKVYLASWFHKQVDGDRYFDVYLSRLDDTTSVTTAQGAAQLLQSTWNYLSDEQAQSAVDSTALDLAGGKVIDMEKAMQPIGDLTVNSIKLSGSFIAPGVSNAVFTDVVALDSIGRSYNVDLSVRSSSNANIKSFNKHYTQQGSMTSSLVAGSNGLNNFAVGNNNNYTAAYSGNTESLPGLGYTVSQTQIEGYSPWLYLDGVFGSVESSSTTEIALHDQFDNGSWVQLGYTITRHDIDPGIVVNTDPVQALYAVFGHKFNGALDGLSVMTGIEPHIIAGALDLQIPDSVDSTGRILYNYDSVALENALKRFARVNYTIDLPYKSQIVVGGGADEEGITDANIKFEMPL